MILTPREIEIRHFHVCCGFGGGARGFNMGHARVGHATAKFRCLGGVDVDAAAIRDFERLAKAKGTVLDLFDRQQYRDFHNAEPPDGWREATPGDLRRAAGGERPHIVFTSSPCKGFSGLLPEKTSKSAKYQALNGLALRSIWLALEAWADDPPELFIFENVPRISVRGRGLLDQINTLFRAYGYVVAETEHDCGEIGNLAQSRKRFLMVARHVEKVPPFLYEPRKRPLRAVGEVLGELPFPLSGLGGPMHRMPSLQWKTWLRLALVEAGSDWRSLNRLRVADGMLQDFVLMPERAWHHGALGVNGWDEPAGTVSSAGRPTNGVFAVADPRFDGHPKSVQLGVRSWHEPAATVTGQMWPGQGPFAIADPRMERVAFNHVYRVVPWQAPSPAIAGSGGPAGGLSVADPRTGFGPGTHHNVLRVTGWDQHARTITGGDHPSGGALCVADPRPDFARDGRDAYLTAGHYGVVPWSSPSGAVTAALVGIVAVFIITLSRALDRYRVWKDARTARKHEANMAAIERSVDREIAAIRERYAKKRAEVHRANPTVHRWPTDRGQKRA